MWWNRRKRPVLHNDIKSSVKGLSFFCKFSGANNSIFWHSNNFYLSCCSWRTGVLLFIDCCKILLEEFKAFSRSILSLWNFLLRLFDKIFAIAFAFSSITRIAESIFSGKVSRKVLITFWKLILESDKFFLHIPTVQPINFREQILSICV